MEWNSTWKIEHQEKRESYSPMEVGYLLVPCVSNILPHQNLIRWKSPTSDWNKMKIKNLPRGRKFAAKVINP